MGMDKINAVVLAGGINHISLYEGYRDGYKSLMLLGGKPMIQFVLDTLRKAPQVGRICIVGPDEISKVVEDPGLYEYIREGKSLKDSVSNGLSHFSDSQSVMMLPADLPLITPFSITHFLKSCSGLKTSYTDYIFWSMVPEGSFAGPFRKVAKGYNRFKDVSVCHGNLYLMTPSVLGNKRVSSLIDKLYDARKSSIKAALQIGLFVGAGYLIGVHLLRLITINGAARKLSRRLGIGIIPVLHEYPEAAVDIDSPEDYRFVAEYMAGKKS